MQANRQIDNKPENNAENKEDKSPSLFEQIYAIAKEAQTTTDEKVIQKLKQVLTGNTSIDVRNSKTQTAAGRLAAEGNKIAAELLMKLGANVNGIARGAALGGHRDYAEWLRHQQGARVNSIAVGAAQGGHCDYAEWLRQQHGANVNAIAQGAACGGHRDYAEWLRQQHGADVNGIAAGAAQGGHRDHAERLRQQHGADVNSLAQGAAQGGHRDYAETLRQQHGASVNWIAVGAGYGGHRDYAEMLRQQHGASVNSIARGAAQGHHHDYAEMLRQQHGASVNWIAVGAAYGGHRDYAEWLRQQHGADVNRIARGAAQGHHHDYAEMLRQQHGASVNSIAQAAANSGDFGNPSHALHVLSFIKDDKYRVELVKELAKALEEKELKEKKLVSYDITKLVPKAQKIAALRPKYSYDQCIALGKIELTTWYLQGAALVKRGRLDPNLLLSIATYLSPLTIKESKDLYEKSRFDTFQKLLVKDLQKYSVNARTLFLFNRDRNAEIFAKIFSEEKDSKKFKTLLTQEAKAVLEDEKSTQPYRDLVTRHYKRLS